MSLRWFILIIVDVLLVLLSLYSAAVVRLGYPKVTSKLSETSTFYTAFIFVLAILFASHLMDTYDFDRNTRKREIIINTLLGAATSFFLLSIIYYVDPNIMLGRGILVISIAIFSLLQYVWHVIFYLVGRHNPRFSRRVLVLGTGSLASQVGEFCSAHNRNYTLAGYALCNCNGASDNEKQCESIVVPPDLIVGNADDLMAATLVAQADIIVVALSERRGVFPLRDVLRCKLNGIEVMDAPSFYELIHGKLMLEQITPSWIIFSSGFRRPIYFSICKRYIDVVLSLGGLFLALPLFPIIALAIKLDSPGPVFFRQMRVGNKEKMFNLFKFRTMRQDAEDKSGAIWATKNDPRVTKLGSLFRKSRIDEIPQLYNVLKGDMSFVGPRPERPEFVEKLKQVIPYYSKRHFIKPGLTGWAQVRYPYGSTIEDAIEKLRYDLFYIKNISPFLDTLIFFETIKVVLFGRGGQ